MGRMVKRREISVVAIGYIHNEGERRNGVVARTTESSVMKSGGYPIQHEGATLAT